jgi:hypothetical protein
MSHHTRFIFNPLGTRYPGLVTEHGPRGNEPAAAQNSRGNGSGLQLALRPIELSGYVQSRSLTMSNASLKKIACAACISALAQPSCSVRCRIICIAGQAARSFGRSPRVLATRLENLTESWMRGNGYGKPYQALPAAGIPFCVISRDSFVVSARAVRPDRHAQSHTQLTRHRQMPSMGEFGCA